MIKYNKKVLFFLLILIFLTFLKIDFRFVNGIFCCSDDFDYFIHAETIAEDFDLNYSNQLKNNEDKRFFKNNISAPIGFFGTGLLSSPFLLLGNLVDQYLFTSSENFMNYKILIYSFSSIFYCLLTINLLARSLKILNINFKYSHLLLFYSGSGIIYYAFERFSMTHVYESFASALIIFFSSKFYKESNNQNFFAFILPLSIMLGLMIRWVNLYLILTPLIIKLISKSKKILISNPYFYLSTTLAVVLFLLHTKEIYGKYTFDPRYVYLSEGNQNINLFSSSEEKFILFEYLENFLNILFTQEFGLLYFSPILFFTIGIIGINFLKNLRKFHFDKLSFLILISFSQVLFTVLLWKSTASSYGFRYLLTLSSIGIVCYFYYQDEYKSKFLNRLLLLLSIFSIFSVLFFETTPATQLSLQPELNSFGKVSSYTSRYYLLGYLNSFLVLESYLKIFTTSFLGVYIFKFLIEIFGDSRLNELLDSLGLPVDNPDFQNYLIEINLVSLDKLIITFLVAFLFVNSIYKNLEKIDK